jgi:hypothetical protein
MKRCFHLPTTVAWRDEPAGLDRSEIERVVLSAIARAVAQAGGADATVVRSSEADSPRARFQALRADRAEGTYRIPSYDRDGAPTDVPLRTAAQGPTRFGQDEVFEAESPFEGKLVAILPSSTRRPGASSSSGRDRSWCSRACARTACSRRPRTRP